MASLCSQKKELGALRSHFLDRDFIIESFTFSGMSLTLKAIRLDILENFVNKTYEKLILKFICWNNDIRPIHFEKIAINYEQSNLRKMLRRFSLMEKHIALMTALMDYPLNELR